MKQVSSALLVIALIIASSSGQANGTAAHTVTVIVEPINELSLAGGDLTLTIDAATAGSQPDAAIDGSARLLWTTNERNRKITVSTDRTYSAFLLSLQAVNVEGGTSTGLVQLGTTPQDLVVGISTTVGSADLHYVASATAGDEPGSEVHTVSFTITADN